MEGIGSATERNSRVPTRVVPSSGIKTYKDNKAMVLEVDVENGIPASPESVEFGRYTMASVVRRIAFE
jgi:hypothetical protein